MRAELDEQVRLALEQTRNALRLAGVVDALEVRGGPEHQLARLECGAQLALLRAEGG